MWPNKLYCSHCFSSRWETKLLQPCHACSVHHVPKETKHKERTSTNDIRAWWDQIRGLEANHYQSRRKSHTDHLEKPLFFHLIQGCGQIQIKSVHVRSKIIISPSQICPLRIVGYNSASLRGDACIIAHIRHAHTTTRAYSIACIHARWLDSTTVYNCRFKSKIFVYYEPES
jgi:hypothetical protein